MIAQRALALLAAALLVAAVAIATFGTESMTLGRALYLFDRNLFEQLPSWSGRVLGNWIWTAVIQPLLDRPDWLVPAAAGIICAGLSLSLFNRKTPHRSHRRS